MPTDRDDPRYKARPDARFMARDGRLAQDQVQTSVPEEDFEVRDEIDGDHGAVAQVNRAAFGRDDEAAMVEAVRADGAATVSLCAQPPPPDREHDPWPVVGHILLSPVTIGDAREPPGLGLAPVAVLPEHQRRGIGSRMVESALERARMLGNAYVVVLGHPGYYPRFGFVPASRFGLRYEPRVPDDVFMALELRPGGLDGVTGVVRYHRAFA